MCFEGGLYPRLKVPNTTMYNNVLRKACVRHVHLYMIILRMHCRFRIVGRDDELHVP